MLNKFALLPISVSKEILIRQEINFVNMVVDRRRHAELLN